MNKTILFTIGYLLLSTVPAWTQETMVHVDIILVVATREFPFTKQVVTVDTFATHPAQWIQMPALSINAYSINGLATLSNRGMSSRHTAILFEGITINGTTTGVADVSLLPLNYFNANKLFKDGMAASFGNHTLGGALLLKSNGSDHNKVTASFSANTLHNRRMGLDINLATKENKFRFFWEEVNDFNKIPYNYSGTRLTSAPFHKKGRNINADASFSLPGKQTLDVAVWLQRFDRDIPGPYFEDLSQFQIDDNLRVVFNHKYHTNSLTFKNQVGFFNEKLNYKASGVNSNAESQQIVLATTATYKDTWIAGATLKSESVNANFYQDTKKRNILMLSGGVKWKIGTSRFQALLSPHFNNGKPTPVNAEIRWESPAFYGSLLRNYNLPGFNDLYWPTGGNINLKTEKSSQINFGANFRLGQNFAVKTSFFSYWIDDYIQWIRLGGSIWTPDNLKKVWSRGGELMVEYNHTNGFSERRVSLQYGFTKATNLADYQSLAVGRQLLYVPVHKASLAGYYGFRKWYVHADLVYVGKRYDTSDNSYFLDPFVTGSLKTGYSAAFKDLVLKIGMGLENIWQTRYEFIRAYPMPLRNITIQSTIQYRLP